MSIMKRIVRWLVPVAALATIGNASATFHLFVIDQVYSNADGRIQFMVFLQTPPADDEHDWRTHGMQSAHDGVFNNYFFPRDLPSRQTSGRRVLIATQGFADLGIVAPDYIVPNGFLGTGAGIIRCCDGVEYKYPSLPTDGVTALDGLGLPVPNVATNFAGASASVTAEQAGGGAAPAVLNFQGLWWAAPAGSESGWGINFAHQEDVIFATWYTYGPTGKTLWLTMTATKTADRTYTGTLYQTRGPAFSAVPFTPSAVTATAVGSGTLTFSDEANGSFSYTVNGIAQTKAITRQVFGAMPTCKWNSAHALAQATNYQDIWWASPGGAESGWGVNFTHQGDTIFATWFTYDTDGSPLWLSATTPKAGPGVYTGTLYRTTGPPFNAVPFLSTGVTATPVGSLTLTFAGGNQATFAYTFNGVTQSKPIERQVFRAPGTTCQ